MKRPPTLAEADARGLLATKETGVHTFSNGTHWGTWAEPNCLSCRFYDRESAGQLCAFEAAVMLSVVSPDLAAMFGWVQKPEYAGHEGGRHGWTKPDVCAFFKERGEDGDGDFPPDPDPLQLVLIADPTEPIASIVLGHVDVAHVGALLRALSGE